MDKRRIILIAAVLIAATLTAISFILTMDKSPRTFCENKVDKARLIYNRAVDSMKAKDDQKAITAFITVVNKYPGSSYAELALNELGAMYGKMGDLEKETYYYNRLLDEFPGTKNSDKIIERLGGLSLDTLKAPGMTGDSVEYVVKSGDSLFAIARRFGTTIDLIKMVNGLQGDVIHPGQKLKIVIAKFSILVDKKNNRLLLRKDGKPFKLYTVSTGKDNSTPVGVFKIEEKMVKPVWYKVNAVVAPDSKEYELGERWMGLSAQGYGIHGTSDESTIGNQVTQGCVRMYNKDVIELFNIVPSGTEVVIKDSVDDMWTEARPRDIPAPQTAEAAPKDEKGTGTS
ncbi:MAG: L,D-transpeptidase family protein [Candidatus Omnitrophica bacterium]|nr:L,D-transpeptidase family protein [Candidatus Omnitrophota bacterium]MDD5488703.1 L,D-transpeptidase family protein [Candidatus Omnitrophota bacterium]